MFHLCGVGLNIAKRVVIMLLYCFFFESIWCSARTHNSPSQRRQWFKKIE